MKTIISPIALSVAVIAFGACQTTTTTNTNTRTNTAVVNSNANSAMNMNGMNHNQMMNDNSMNNNGVMNHSEMKSSPNAASAPYDLQFLDTMTHHHQGALDMAKVAV